jgi:uncharacterized membrane protein
MLQLRAPRDKSVWILLGVLVLALFLRFYRLGGRPFYMDEPFHTIQTAAKPLPVVLSTNTGSILYELLVHILLPLGKMEVMARLPAALFGFLSVWLVYLIGAMIFGKREALFAAFLSATSTHFIYFSQQARGYSGLLLFSLCSLYFFLRALKCGGFLNWAMYALSTVVAVYMHFFGLIIIPAQIFIFAVLWGRQRFSKSLTGEFVLSKKTLFSLGLALFSAAVFVYLLYLPARGQQANENLFLMLPHAIKSLLQGRLTLNPVALVSDILKRQLAYSVSAVFFYIVIGLAVCGALASLKRWSALLVLGSWIAIPLIGFVLSNPPEIYLPVDNKFIFILPAIFLLAARGVIGFCAFPVRVLSRAFRERNHAVFAGGLLTWIVVLLMAGEVLWLQTFNTINMAIWSLKSLPRDKEVSTYLNARVTSDEMIFSDSKASLLDYISMRPIFYGDAGRKFLMFYELADSNSRGSALSPAGLWIHFARSQPDDRTILQWKASAPEMKIDRLPRSLLIHFPEPEKPLWEKLVLAARMMLDLPHSEGEENGYLLFLTKFYLLGLQNQDALKEWARVRRLEASGYPRGKEEKILRYSLMASIFNLFLENAGLALREGDEADATALWRAAEEYNPESLESRARVYFSQAESFLENRMADRAKKKYFDLLPLCRNAREESYVVGRLREILTLPSGYILWRSGSEWRLRWWSQTGKIFKGEISGFKTSPKVQKRSWTREDTLDRFLGKLSFRAVASKGKIKGFDFQDVPGSKFTVLLRIEGMENILNKIIIAGKNGWPESLPFFLD